MVFPSLLALQTYVRVLSVPNGFALIRADSARIPICLTSLSETGKFYVIGGQHISKALYQERLYQDIREAAPTTRHPQSCPHGKTPDPEPRLPYYNAVMASQIMARSTTLPVLKSVAAAHDVAQHAFNEVSLVHVMQALANEARGKVQNRQEPWLGKNQLAMAVIRTGVALKPTVKGQPEMTEDKKVCTCPIYALTPSIITAAAPIRRNDNPSLSSQIDYVSEHYEAISFIMAANCDHPSFIAYIANQEARHTEEYWQNMENQDEMERDGGRSIRDLRSPPSDPRHPCAPPCPPLFSTATFKEYGRCLTLPDARLFRLKLMGRWPLRRQMDTGHIYTHSLTTKDIQALLIELTTFRLTSYVIQHPESPVHPLKSMLPTA